MRRIVMLLLPALVAGCSGGERLPLPQVDFVLVDKSERTLKLYRQDKMLRTYRIQLGDAPEGHKQFEGDEKTPEGRYTIDYRNARSKYHLSLHISYPDQADWAYARKHQRLPGGEIFIHGQPDNVSLAPGGRVPGDWTDGCIAIGNEDIEEMWTAVRNGTPIEIRP